ncbi:hypothetical protein GLYMA_20G074100v4 [Glycine max]|uniref:Uncharacterized protein n=1 Tax=Glycine max TaxID=3847 RepID=A0A0R0E901_SOYBN|nr:hypothetical protein GLYMA_20G074100v4 [Glycine max]
MGSGHIKVGPTSLSLLRSLPPSFPLALLDYQDYDKFGLRFPNFNFNVSHHDIVSYDVPLGETITEFIQFFSSYFSSLEWDNIVNSGTSNDVLTEFYRNKLIPEFCIYFQIQLPRKLAHACVNPKKSLILSFVWKETKVGT